MAQDYKLLIQAELANIKDITKQVKNAGKDLKIKADIDTGNILEKTEKIKEGLYTTVTLTKKWNKEGKETANIQTVVHNQSKKIADQEKKQKAELIAKEKEYARVQKERADTVDKGNKSNLLSIENIKDSMKTALVRSVEWGVSMGVLYGTLSKLKDIVGIVVDLDNKMTNIRMITGSTNEEAQQLLKTFQGLARETSSLTSQVAITADEFLRQGRSVEETNELIKTSTVFSKVAFLESAESAELLTSAINGYGISAMNAMSVVDKMSAIDVAAATSSEELAKAMARTANSADLAGVSMDDLLSYIATVSEVTRGSAESIGNSFKTIFSRIQAVKLGSLFDEEGESVSNVEAVLKQYQITLRDLTTGDFRDTSTVLDELSAKWDGFNNAQKSEIATTIAGVRQRENFLVLMENFSRATELSAISSNSAGSALEKFNIYQDSTSAKLAELRNEFEIFATNTLDSKVVKSVIDLGKALLQFANSDVGQTMLKITALTAVIGLTSKAFSLLKAAMAVNTSNILIFSIQALIAGAGTLTEVISLLTTTMFANPLFAPIAVLAGVTALISAVDLFTTTLKEQEEIVKSLSSEINTLQSEYDTMLGRDDLTKMEEVRLLLMQQEILAKKTQLKQEAEFQYMLMNRPKQGLAFDSSQGQNLESTISKYKELQSQVANTAKAEYDRQSQISKLSQVMSQQARQLMDLKDAGVELSIEDEKLLRVVENIAKAQVKQSETSVAVIDHYGNAKSALNNYIEELKYLDATQKLVDNGTSLSLEQKDELLERYPQLTDEIKRTAEGWTIEASSLEILRKQSIQTANDKISAEKADLENRKRSLMAKLKLDQAEIQSAQQVVNAMYARAQVNAKNIKMGSNTGFQGSSQGFGAPEQAELINLFGQISAIDAIIGTVGSISGGGISGGKAPTAKKEKEGKDPIKEAFDKQYKALQHQLTMNEISEAQYLDKLDVLYKKYFSNKKKYLDEYNQYEEEVYTKRKKMEEDALKESLEKQKENIEKQKEALTSLVDLVVDLIKFEKQQEKDYYTELIAQEKDKHSKVIENLKEEVEQKKKALESELDSYKKIIEAQLESIRIKESERDYQDDLAEKQKELAKLEAELQEVSFDDTAEGKAKRLALEEEISNQSKEISELQHDREIELTEEALNKELSDYEETINTKLDKYDAYLEKEEKRYEDSLDERISDYEDHVKDIDNYLKKEGALRTEANTRIETEGQALYAKLTAYNAEYGSLSQDALSTMWDTAGDAMTAYEQKQLSVLDTLKALANQMNKVTTALGGTAIDVDGGGGSKAQEQLNQQKYLHNLAVKAKAEGNTDLLKWLEKEREKWGLDPKSGAIVEKFHTGIDKGFVGGKSMMKSNESLAMLMEGEAVLTPEQMDKFMRITLPTMLGMNPTTFGSGGGIEINMPLTVEGGITSEALPDFKLAMKEVAETVIGQVNKAMSQRGQIRNAKAVSI